MNSKHSDSLVFSRNKNTINSRMDYSAAMSLGDNEHERIQAHLNSDSFRLKDSIAPSAHLTAGIRITSTFCTRVTGVTSSSRDVYLLHRMNKLKGGARGDLQFSLNSISAF